MKNRVVVAMSGGVDSSVAAALLKKQVPMFKSGSRLNLGSFDVIGVFMKLWVPEEVGVENKCCNIDSLEGARRVAAKLEIPFYTIDLIDEFRRYVVDYYIKEYKNCRTPNPCVICNKFIKFNFLLKKALALGAEYLATGHYVRIADELKTQNSKLKTTTKNLKLKLLTAKDKTKDQSYFLWTLTQEQLKHLLFPIGDYTKEQVREMAKKWQLPTAERAESQGLCFIGYWDNQEFLERFIKPKPGLITDLKGNILGEHKGLPFYTTGQRKGLEINVKSPETPPLYVIRCDTKNNTLIVDEEKDLYKKELYADEINWVHEPKGLLSGYRCGVRIRYGHPIVNSKIQIPKSKNKLKVIFEKPVRAITPGQSIVFYKKQEVLGGGIIE